MLKKGIESTIIFVALEKWKYVDYKRRLQNKKINVTIYKPVLTIKLMNVIYKVVTNSTIMSCYNHTLKDTHVI